MPSFGYPRYGRVEAEQGVLGEVPDAYEGER